MAGALQAVIKGRSMALDVASILQPGRPRRFAFLSVTYGMIPKLDIGTDHLRWMGNTRFILGAVGQIIAQGTFPVNVAIAEGDADEALPSGAAPPARPAEPGPPLRYTHRFQQALAGGGGRRGVAVVRGKTGLAFPIALLNPRTAG